MNKQQKIINKMRVMDLIESSSKVGNLKIWKNTTYKHAKTMFDICFKLINQGLEIYTEVTFKNGCRADIVVLDYNKNGYAIEVLHTETDKRFNLKLESYPLPIIKVNTKEFDIDKWDL